MNIFMTSPGPVLEIASTDSGFATISALLRRKGVRVQLTKGSPRKDGTLVLQGNDLVFTINKMIKTKTTTSLSNIYDVQLVDAGQEGIFCRNTLKEGAEFSFVCSGTGNVSRQDMTKLVAMVIKDAVNRQKTPVAPRAPPELAFRRLLEPIGLLNQYNEAFISAAIDAEDLRVVTREDLIELVGVTDRRHQIKILAQIKRCYPEYPPCCCSRYDHRNDRSSAQGGCNQTAASGELAAKAGNIVGGVVASFL